MGDNSACDTYRPMLSAYIDTELAPKDRALLERHLMGCTPCNMRAVDLRAESALVRVGLDYLADEADFKNFSHKVLARLTPEQPPLGQRLLLFFQETFVHQRGTWVTVAATALVMLVVGLPWVLRSGPPPGYAQARIEVQTVRVVEGAGKAFRPVVLENDSGDAIIFLSDTPTKNKVEDDLLRREETGVEPDGSNTDTKPLGGEL